MDDLEVTLVPKSLYYHEVAHVRYLENMRETIIKIVDAYKSQAKFADPEPAAYYRDFIRSLEVALTPR